MDRQIRYLDFENDSQQKIIEELVERYERLMPHWVLRLTVYYSGNAESTVLSIGLNPEYHKATINVYSGFFSEEESLFEKHFVHEIIHMHLAQLTEWTKYSVLEYVKSRNNDLYEYLVHENKNRVEWATESLTWLVTELLSNGR